MNLMQSDIYTSPDATDAITTRNQIDIDIEKYLAIVLALRTRRNEFAPISRLPTEIFIKIFLIVKTAPPSRSFPPSPLKWIEISHVCTSWRRMALGSPILWDDPPLTLPEWTKIMLERSKAVNLNITFDCRNQYYVAKEAVRDLKCVLQKNPRVGRLTLLNFDPRNVNGQMVLDALPKSMPQLESLHMGGDYLGAYPYPAEMLKGAGRKLYQLVLLHSTVKGTLQFPRTITELALKDTTYPPNLTVQDLAGALGELLSLEILRLENAIPPGQYQSEISPSTMPNIQFRHLKYLLVSELTLTRFPTGTTEDFLSLIACPSSAIIRISCDVIASRISAVMQSLKHLYIYLKPIQEFKTLYVDDGSLPGRRTPSVQFKLFKHALVGDLAASHKDLDQFRLALGLKVEGDVSNAITEFFKSGIPGKTISHVHLLGKLKIRADTLIQTTGLLPKVVYVWAGGPMCNVMVQILRPRSNILTRGQNAHVHDTTTEKLYFLGLSSLTLAGVDFYLAEHTSYQEDYVRMEQLEECLIHRYKHSAAIKTLRIENCQYLKPESVERLRKIVGNVEWDGKEIREYGYDYDPYDYDLDDYPETGRDFEGIPDSD